MGTLSYLQQYDSDWTIKNYKASLKTFFASVYGQREPLEALAERYFQEERNHEEDVQRLLVSIKNLAPKSKRLRLSAVRIFLVENSVELGEKFWRRTRGRIKGSRALTVDKVPTHKEFRQILEHLPVNGRALFIVLLSSGMRIGEAMQLKPGDVELGADPAKVKIRGEYTKSGNPRVTFISREAKEAIDAWLKVRDAYLEAAVAKSTMYEKEKDDPRLFPWDQGNSYGIWNKALYKSGLNGRDSKTRYHKFHPHVLRKFFRTRLGTVIPVDIVEILMGHEAYLTEVYRRYSVEDLAKFYREGEHVLHVFGADTEQIAQLNDQLKQDRDNLQRIVNGLHAENLGLKNQLAEHEVKLAELIQFRERMERLQERIEALEEHTE